MGYKHLTREQRYTIEMLLQTPMNMREIGEVIGVSTGTVSREIHRNCDMRGYHRPRKSLGYRTPLEYCKQLFNFDFEVCCTSN